MDQQPSRLCLNQGLLPESSLSADSFRPTTQLPLGSRDFLLGLDSRKSFRRSSDSKADRAEPIPLRFNLSQVPFATSRQLIRSIVLQHAANCTNAIGDSQIQNHQNVAWFSERAQSHSVSFCRN